MEEKQLKINHSVQKVFAIIEIMTAAESPMTLNDISKQTTIPKATASRLLYTLMTLGYVQQNPKTADYSLSLKFKLLTNSTTINHDIVSLVRPYMQQISSELNEATCLSLCDKQELVYIESIDSQDNLLNVTQKIGKRAPLYCTGAGKLYLSKMSEEELEHYLAQTQLVPLTNQTIVTEKALKKELLKVREQGFSIDDEECELGVRCVAIPLMDQQQTLLATLSVSMPAIRASREKTNQTVEVLKNVTRNFCL
ncbi:IclR family transcriptional regulator [Candidatus Enterococcus murrayae]|uniref:IclR family transcriptional regulator n=1 Tax=Candidatus Enterococcus murrayae TaxID=2815321 RepID=A0ABS3HGB1_9ENTE|nr:IclR family transcriptional regulator [Enterococcus sp. MJM16]MBO0452482.1 IclR family transcriptional regulator [Enterococcus sp. MJM16]